MRISFRPGHPLALCLAALPSALQAQIVTDGGFDGQAATVTQYCYNSSCPTGDWTMYGGAGFIKQGNTAWPAPIPASPSWVAFLQSNQGGLQQTITVPTAGSYIVVFRLASRHGFTGSDGNQTVAVRVDNQMLSQRSLSSNEPFNRYVSAAIALTAGTHTLLLTGETAGDHTAFVDSVAVVPATSTTSYQYDALGRLTGVNQTGGANAGIADGYTYDSAGNRTLVSASGAN